ncbi:MAG: dTDP-4-dehydrorhamnose reductase [Hyphomicrobiales bacterium]|nr:MAG: dTDP-4-dehydrorhamnose reductase [Hyphomicrobiales bacterium]
MKLLVIGREGQLARALAAELPARPDITATFAGHAEADLAQEASLREVVARHAPHLVINAGAYTAVDKAEDEIEAARAANATGPGHLAELCAARGIPLIHVSTDYVFNGRLDRPYREDDATDPLGSYGRSKLEGEERIAAALSQHVILRTAWVHSPWGKNFVKTMLALGATRDELRVVDDQIGCPTYAPHLAHACLDVAHKILTAPDAGVWGTFHCAGSGETTWYGFAREILRVAARSSARDVRVTPITTADYPTRAVRPANSRLDCAKFAKTFGLSLPAWEIGAKQCVEAIMALPTGSKE